MFFYSFIITGWFIGGMFGFLLIFEWFVMMVVVSSVFEVIVLVIEDDINIVDLLNLYLREVGYWVLLVFDGEYGFI